MSYNSNGYIMLDFSMLDFSRTNQIIVGIYQRVFEIVGTNKFVLILNAQSKTPLPACVSFINSSYVIESFLYNFSITMDDNVRIENVSSDLIKDGIVSAGTTWSSSKIQNELSKVSTANLYKNYYSDFYYSAQLQKIESYVFNRDCIAVINLYIQEIGRHDLLYARITKNNNLVSSNYRPSSQQLGTYPVDLIVSYTDEFKTGDVIDFFVQSGTVAACKIDLSVLHF